VHCCRGSGCTFSHPPGSLLVLRLKRPHLQVPETSVAPPRDDSCRPAQQPGESQVVSSPCPGAQGRGDGTSSGGLAEGDGTEGLTPCGAINKILVCCCDM